jgi:choline dehydrogenase-like flavoprotein
MNASISRDFYARARYGDAFAVGLLTPSARGFAAHALPSCSIGIEASAYALIGTPYLGWSPLVMTLPVKMYRRIQHREPGLAARLRRAGEWPWKQYRLRQTGRVEQAARLRARAVDADEASKRLTSLYFRAEQIPDRMSRVSLGDRRDELGVPLTRLDWRVRDVDRVSILRWLSLLDDTLGRSGVARVVMPGEGWESRIIGGPHHMGTTRMSADPRHGVVDAHCRVHSVDNLYVAGSSVFATGGHANPTMTIVAMALRLADRLREVL